MTGSRVFFFVVSVALLCSGCSTWQPPQPSSTIDIKWEVQEPTRTSPSAEIFVTETGFWAYIPDDQEDLDDELTAGDLLVFETDDADHFFVIVQISRWGYRMQRLGDRPIATEINGELRRVTSEMVDDQPELCVISEQSQLADECGLSHRHRRWHLYDLGDDASNITVDGDFANYDDLLGFPVMRRGLAGGDQLSTWIETGDPNLSGPMLAIRAESRSESTLSATVAYDASCGAAPAASSRVDTHSFVTSDSPVEFPVRSHPVAIENAALQLGADAIIDCDDGIPRLLVPMLARPLLRDDDGRYFAPSSLGLVPRRLQETSDTSVAAWTRAGALVAVGDAAAASFWIERALTDEIQSDSQIELVLASMTTLASAGQPELAKRVGDGLTRRAWNPENIPDYLDGLIVLLSRFGDHSDMTDRIDRRQSLSEQRFDAHRTGLYRWADVRLHLANHRGTYGPAYHDLIADLEDDDLDEWALAVWATLQMHGLKLPVVDEPEELRERFADLGADALWSHLIDEPGATSCSDDSNSGLCRPAAYGWVRRAEAADGDDIERLRTTGLLDTRRGFTDDHLTKHSAAFDLPSQRTAYWLAVAPLTPDDDLSMVTRTVLDALTDQFERNRGSVCDDLSSWQARFENAAARARDPVLTRSRREWVNFIDWWTDDGLQNLCAEPEDFLNAVERHVSESNPWTRTVLPLVESQILKETAATSDVTLFERSAGLAQELGDDDTCSLWSLGISIGTARAGLFDTAEDHLVTATNCLSTDSDLRSARNLVAGYLDFERAAGQNLIRDGNVEKALAQATRRHVDDRDTCIGLLPMGFQLETLLPASVMRIAERIQLGPAPHDDFSLRTASTFIDEARAAYLVGVRDIQRGRLTTAAMALDRADADFRRIQHLPGIARIRFLDHLIFDGRLREIAETEELDFEPASESIEALRNGQSRALIDQSTLAAGLPSDVDPAPLIAAYLIARRDDEVAEKFGTTELPSLLCAPESADELFDEDKPPIITGGDDGHRDTN